MVLYDPKTSKIVRECSWKEMEKASIDLINNTLQERRNAKKPNPETVCVIHNVTGEHRYFLFDPNYPGAMGHAEAILSSYKWRIASSEEEAACLKKDEAEQQEAYLKSAAGQKQFNDSMAVTAMKMITERGEEKAVPEKTKK